MNLIQNPPEGWLKNLREGNQVWLAKEQEIALVEAPFILSDQTYRYTGGRIIITRRSGGIFKWYTDANGRGFDGKPLFLPIEGHMPDSPDSISAETLQDMKRTIANMANGMNQIYAALKVHGIMQ